VKKNGKRELRNHPGEQFFQCEFCGDYFHHNGIGMHRHYCQNRSPDDRKIYKTAKHTLRLPAKNSSVDVNVPVTARFLTDRDRERLHVTVSISDSVLINLGKQAAQLGLVVFREDDEDGDG
jgi:hypothetical protein